MIRFGSAGCGSGKTYQIVKRACRMAAAGERVIILQPTIELIDKTIEQELLSQPDPPLYEVFHGGTVGKGASVAHAITEYLKSAPNHGQIVFATQQVLPRIGFFANKSSWNLIADEELQVLDHASHRLPKTHPIITQHLALEPYNAIHSRIVPSDLSAIKSIAKNEVRDDIHETLSGLARTLTTNCYRSYVNTEQFEKLKSGEAANLDVNSVLQPSLLSGFASVFMAAANFRDTAIKQVWGELGVKFEEDEDFTKSLRFREHKNGSLVTICYADEAPWSRNRRDREWSEREGQTTIELIAQAAKQRFGANPYIWQANVNQFEKNNPFGPENKRLPNVPHGLNDYSDINNIAFFSSLNPSPEQFRFLESIGIESEAVRRAIYFQAAYQSVMRTSIRNPDNTDAKTIFVPDRGLGEYLQQMLPGSTIEKVDAGIPEIAALKPGRRRQYSSNRDKQAEYRRRKKSELLSELSAVGCPYPSQDSKLGEPINEMEKDPRVRYETTIDNSYFVTPPRSDGTLFSSQPLLGTLYRDKFSNYPIGYLKNIDTDELIDVLRCFHLDTGRSKERSLLFSPAVFDPDRGLDKKRGLNNIVYVRNLWLDFENGDLKPEEFQKLFPHTQMVMMNTYHHTSEKPRFRVVLPVKQTLTAETYVTLWDLVAKKIENAGYQVRPRKEKAKIPVRQSGLDRSKRTPVSLFYLPSQAQDSKQSFFHVYTEGRQVLDAELWIRNSVIPIPLSYKPEISNGEKRKTVDQKKVEAATEEWRRSARTPGQGNDRFFRYALNLRKAGLELSEIESKLNEESGSARSPAERRAQIPSIIRFLNKWGRRAA